ncbi:adenylyl-sulfate kinase [Microbacterium sp. EST19A]|uniref:adenylyl-sulfate kinase n=1 Tax=Microbacterium sp. EST19A TaxID=2862681 RepID=UPI001CBE242D|nr:adenylyl-sulfate kinase [Microbacterium sp. EST19A]
MDVLRLAGVPGVGKSTVAWAVARQLAVEGVRVGYVDIDQLGMCYPAPADDPDRWSLKERALARVAAQFAASGVERLVVSGVAEPSAPPQGNGHPTVSLWLGADEVTRRERLAPRGWAREQVDEVLAIGTRETASAHWGWTRVETDGSPVNGTVRAVRGLWRGGIAGVVPVSAVADAGTTEHVVWITGPRCAGASRVGWETVAPLWAEGRRTGFIDVAQLDFAWNVDTRLGMRNAAELQRVFSAAGARTLVAVAPLEVSPDEVRAAFPRADVRLIRLDADEESRRDRALRRAAGTDALLAGDDLIGASERVIEEIVALGSRQRETPVRAGERVIDTTATPLPQVVAQVAAELAR